MSIVEQPFGIIYRATNRLNGKVYVGQTTRGLSRRRQEHHEAASRDVDYAFCRAIRKYSVDGFDWDIIDTAQSIEELNGKETRWIAEYKTTDSNLGYNSTTGGNGVKYTEEARRNMSEGAKRSYRNGRIPPRLGAVWSDEMKRKMSETKFAGMTDERRAAYSRSMQRRMASVGWVPPHQGKRHSEESRKKMSETGKRKYTNGEITGNTFRCISVQCIETGIIYRSLREAANAVGLSQPSMSNAISGKMKTAAGFHWVKVENPLKSSVTTQSATAS